MKRFAALLPVLAAACEAPTRAKADVSIECAVEGSAAFERVCTVERGDRGRLILRSPSGSFRRMTITRDGRGVMAADGAEPATVTVLGKDLIEVAIGSDRYRLPARVR